MEVKIKVVGENPKKGTTESGAFDFYVREIEKIDDDFVSVKLGFHLSMPKGMILLLCPRSSFTKTKWVMQNSPGIGDSDFRGEYRVMLRALPNGCDLKTGKLSYSEFPYKIGDRIVQGFFVLPEKVQLSSVLELDETDRGNGGFGSTGI